MTIYSLNVLLLYSFLEPICCSMSSSNCCFLTCIQVSQEADPMDCSTPGSSVLHSPGVCSNSCLLIQWCYLTITSSATPFSFCLQSFPASGSSAMSQLFCIRWPKYWSFSFSISPSSEYSGLISLRIYRFDPCVFLDICFSISAFPIIFYTIFLDSTYMC